MRYLILIAVLSLASFSHAQNWQSLDGPYGQIVTGMSQGSNGLICASSYLEGIFVRDGGDWTKSYSAPGVYGWSCVEVLAKDLIIAGRSSFVASSSDRGITWQTRLGNIEATDVGFFTYVVRTRDSVVMSFTSNGEGARILFSDHLCRDWESRQIDYTNTSQVHAMAVDSNGVVVAAGYESYRRTVDHFATVTSARMDDPWRTVTALAVDSSGRVWIAATDRGVRIASDGADWRSISQKLPDTLWSAAVTPRGIAFVGSAEGVHTSTDGGETWTEFNKGLPAGFVASYLYVAPDGHLYVGTNGAGIFKTADPVTAAYAVLPELKVEAQKETPPFRIVSGQIIFNVPQSSTITFIDLLGREVDLPFERQGTSLSIRQADLQALMFGIVDDGGKLTSIKLPSAY